MASETPKRKACDLCYHKKSKCDRQMPQCSTCILYDSPCTRKAASRKKKPRREAQNDSSDSGLQERLDAALADVERLEGILSRSAAPQPAEDSPFPPVWRGRGDFRSREVALPIVERFLETFNSVYPLFDPQALLRTFRTWYTAPDRSDMTTWALINVVLALAHYTGCSTNCSSNYATYVHNAQAVLSEVISADVQLINVQIALGLAILFWNIHNIQPSLILTATAIRLLHRLGLHSKELCNQNLRPEDLAQGRRVFWMAYIIDRAISDVARVPPLQLDIDIDVDLPPLGLEDGLAGFVFSADGTCALNFFRARVELAQIQGTVYQQVYSVSAKAATSDERSQNIALIYKALDDWGDSIPVAFRPVSLDCSTALPRYMCSLYAVRLMCRAKVSHASTYDSYHLSEWIEQVQDQSDNMSDDASLLLTSPPMPLRWQTLVDESRYVLWLYSSVSRRSRDAVFFSMSRCAYFTGLITLLANCIYDTRPDFLQFDQIAIDEAWAELQEVASLPEATHLRASRDAVRQLKACASKVSDQKRALFSWAEQSRLDLEGIEIGAVPGKTMHST